MKFVQKHRNLPYWEFFMLCPTLSQTFASIAFYEFDAEQKKEENNCGQRCLAWLYVCDKQGPDKAMTI